MRRLTMCDLSQTIILGVRPWCPRWRLTVPWSDHHGLCCFSDVGQPGGRAGPERGAGMRARRRRGWQRLLRSGRHRCSDHLSPLTSSKQRASSFLLLRPRGTDTANTWRNVLKTKRVRRRAGFCPSRPTRRTSPHARSRAALTGTTCPRCSSTGAWGSTRLQRMHRSGEHSALAALSFKADFQHIRCNACSIPLTMMARDCMISVEIDSRYQRMIRACCELQDAMASQRLLDEAIKSLHAAAEFSRADVAPLNALGDALVARAERAQGPDAAAHLRDAVEQGYGAALRIDRANTDGLVGDLVRSIMGQSTDSSPSAHRCPAHIRQHATHVCVSQSH